MIPRKKSIGGLWGCSLDPRSGWPRYPRYQGHGTRNGNTEGASLERATKTTWRAVRCRGPRRVTGSCGAARLDPACSVRPRSGRPRPAAGQAEPAAVGAHTAGAVRACDPRAGGRVGLPGSWGWPEGGVSSWGLVTGGWKVRRCLTLTV